MDTRIWTLYLVTHTKKWTYYNHLKINDYLIVIFSTFFFLCVCDQIDGPNPCVHPRISRSIKPWLWHGFNPYLHTNVPTSNSKHRASELLFILPKAHPWIESVSLCVVYKLLLTQIPQVMCNFYDLPKQILTTFY